MAQEKPFEKLRPSTQKAIRNETKRKMEGRYPRTWIDAALGIDDPPWWWQGVTWLPGRAVPAFLTGIGEAVEGIDIMLSPVDTELKQNLELAIENAENYRRTRGENSWQYQHAKQHVDRLFAEWHAGGSEEWRKGKLGIEALHQQILDEADPPHLRALREQAKLAFDDGRGYMSKEHRDAVKAYNEAKAKPYPTPIWDAFKANYSKYKLWTAEGREKFWTTLVNRPDEIVGDVSVFAPYLKASKIGGIAKVGKWVDRLDLSNVVDTVVDATKATNKLKPPLRADTSNIDTAALARLDLVSGKQISQAQIDKWDTAPNVFYRITNASRLDQPRSLQFDQGEGIEEDIREALIQGHPAFEKFAPELTLQDLLDVSGTFMSYSEAKKRWGDKLVKKEYDYWYNYVEAAESSFKVTPIKPVEIDGEIVEMQYLGVNGSDRFDVIYEYLRRREWDNVIKKEEDRSVLQVIQGDEIGETWSGDGKIIKPRETLAVFDVDAIKRFPYTVEVQQ